MKTATDRELTDAIVGKAKTKIRHRESLPPPPEATARYVLLPTFPLDVYEALGTDGHGLIAECPNESLARLVQSALNSFDTQATRLDAEDYACLDLVLEAVNSHDSLKQRVAGLEEALRRCSDAFRSRSFDLAFMPGAMPVKAADLFREHEHAEQVLKGESQVSETKCVNHCGHDPMDYIYGSGGCARYVLKGDGKLPWRVCGHVCTYAQPEPATILLSDTEKALLNKVFRAVHDLVCPHCGSDMIKPTLFPKAPETMFYRCSRCKFIVHNDEMIRMQTIVQEWGQKAVMFFNEWRQR